MSIISHAAFYLSNSSFFSDSSLNGKSGNEQEYICNINKDTSPVVVCTHPMPLPLAQPSVCNTN